jgi:hypothetical protein
MSVSADEIRGARKVRTSQQRELVLAFASVRKRRGRPDFSYRDVRAILKLTKGLASVSNANRHVNELTGAKLLNRDGRRNSKFRISDLGEAVATDWGLAPVPPSRAIGPRAPVSDDLSEAARVAESAAELLDDLIGRLKRLTADSNR